MPRRKRKIKEDKDNKELENTTREEEEGVSRWFFSDEDLQEAIRNIVDVVPVAPRYRTKRSR